MENKYLEELIMGGNSVIVCHSDEDIIRLAKMVDRIYPGYESKILCQKTFLGSGRYKEEIAIRIDAINKFSLDCGHSYVSWYKNKGRKIIEFLDLVRASEAMDYGDIPTAIFDVRSLLFGI